LDAFNQCAKRVVPSLGEAVRDWCVLDNCGFQLDHLRPTRELRTQFVGICHFPSQLI
jgi:hypothetical protein